MFCPGNIVPYNLYSAFLYCSAHFRHFHLHHTAADSFLSRPIVLQSFTAGTLLKRQSNETKNRGQSKKTYFKAADQLKRLSIDSNRDYKLRLF